MLLFRPSLLPVYSFLLHFRSGHLPIVFVTLASTMEPEHLLLVLFMAYIQYSDTNLELKEFSMLLTSVENRIQTTSVMGRLGYYSLYEIIWKIAHEIQNRAAFVKGVEVKLWQAERNETSKLGRSFHVAADERFQLNYKQINERVPSRPIQFFLYFDEQEDGYLHSKRVCIKTTLVENIYESFKVIIQGKTFWILAKEVSGWMPDFEEDIDQDSKSDNELSNEGSFDENGGLRITPNVEGESDLEELAETIFEKEQASVEVKEGCNSVQKETRSEDPFNIYDLLDKKKSAYYDIPVRIMKIHIKDSVTPCNV
ncbi:hypothetical protein Tco_1439709 [Tanacetum coccineum]